MTSALQPIIVTPDLDRLQRFYASLLDAPTTSRYPDDGAAFSVGLRVGDTELGLVVNGDAVTGTPQRILLSVDVQDVDALLPRVEELGGRVLGPPNDMPWGQRVAHVQDPDGNALNLTQSI